MDVHYDSKIDLCECLLILKNHAIIKQDSANCLIYVNRAVLATLMMPEKYFSIQTQSLNRSFSSYLLVNRHGMS